MAYSYDRRATAVREKDKEDLALIEDTVKQLIRGQYGGHPPEAMDFKTIDARSPVSSARMRGLIKRYPKIVAKWFGGKDLSFQSPSTSGGSGGGYIKPFTYTDKPTRQHGAVFWIIK